MMPLQHHASFQQYSYLQKKSTSNNVGVMAFTFLDKSQNENLLKEVSTAPISDGLIAFTSTITPTKKHNQ